jgi:competence protein ComEA
VVRLLAAGAALLVLVGALAGLALRSAPEPPPQIELPDEEPAESAPAFIVVDVAGAVARPGVFRLPAGSRVVDAIAQAGGLTAQADAAALNQAALLRDGARVYVPRAGEAAPAGSVGTAAETKLDINRASQAELVALPGIGPTTASRILRAREQKPFAKVEELQTRGLVPQRVFAEIRDLITTR